MELTVRLRLALRGVMGAEDFDVETFSGTARRASQRPKASAAAREKSWIIASAGIDEGVTKGFLKGLTYRELAEVTGGKELT
eukprot:6233866-Pyramimonas_sp.AAC.1